MILTGCVGVQAADMSSGTGRSRHAPRWAPPGAEWRHRHPIYPPQLGPGPASRLTIGLSLVWPHMRGNSAGPRAPGNPYRASTAIFGPPVGYSGRRARSRVGPWGGARSVSNIGLTAGSDGYPVLPAHFEYWIMGQSPWKPGPLKFQPLRQVGTLVLIGG